MPYTPGGRLTNPQATRLMLLRGAAFFVMAQWEESARYVARMVNRRRVRAALTAWAFLLMIRRQAATRRTERARSAMHNPRLFALAGGGQALDPAGERWYLVIPEC